MTAQEGIPHAPKIFPELKESVISFWVLPETRRTCCLLKHSGTQPGNLYNRNLLSTALPMCFHPCWWGNIKDLFSTGELLLPNVSRLLGNFSFWNWSVTVSKLWVMGMQLRISCITVAGLLELNKLAGKWVYEKNNFVFLVKILVEVLFMRFAFSHRWTAKRDKISCCASKIDHGWK